MPIGHRRTRKKGGVDDRKKPFNRIYQGTGEDKGGEIINYLTDIIILSR